MLFIAAVSWAGDLTDAERASQQALEQILFGDVGRYQMATLMPDMVFILDTKNGKVWLLNYKSQAMDRFVFMGQVNPNPAPQPAPGK